MQYLAVYLANTFLFYLEEDQREVAFTWLNKVYIMILPQGSINSSVLCHNIVQRVLDHLEILKTATLVYNMGGTLLF